jgi:aryl-alcohol dehydrogenase-like predicted oxidoreductase
MNYKQLGRTGLRVSPICVGCMTFGREIDEGAAVPIIAHALDAGINFFDTANTYAGGKSEEIVGRALKSARDRVVIATKFANPVGDGPNERGASRRSVMAAIDVSLRRLQTDYVDLYQVHHFDPLTPLEETLGALDDIVRAGKVRYIGCSNFAAWQIVKSLWISDRRSWQRFVCLQPRYSLVFREAEAELLPMCAEEGLGVITYSPLGGGFLTGKYKQGIPLPPDTRMAATARYRSIYSHDKNYRVVDALETYARGRGIAKEELALAWVMSHPAVTAPIVGLRTQAQLETALAAYNLNLTGAQREELTKVVDEA